MRDKRWVTFKAVIRPKENLKWLKGILTGTSFFFSKAPSLTPLPERKSLMTSFKERILWITGEDYKVTDSSIFFWRIIIFSPLLKVLFLNFKRANDLRITIRCILG